VVCAGAFVFRPRARQTSPLADSPGLARPSAVGAQTRAIYSRDAGQRRPALHMQDRESSHPSAGHGFGEQEARIGPDAPGGRALLPSAGLERSDEGNGEDLTIVGGRRCRSVKHGHVGPRSHSRFGGRGAEHRLGDNSHPPARRPPRRRFDRPGSARRTDGSATGGHRSRGTPALA